MSFKMNFQLPFSLIWMLLERSSPHPELSPHPPFLPGGPFSHLLLVHAIKVFILQTNDCCRENLKLETSKLSVSYTLGIVHVDQPRRVWGENL